MNLSHEPEREPKIVSSIADVAKKVRFARGTDDLLGKVIFLIGAGCSVSAGVPGAVEIAKRIARYVAKRFCSCPAASDDVAIYRALVEKRLLKPCLINPDAEPRDTTIDWYRVYDDMFRQHYTAPDDVRDLFDGLVREAYGAINWAHLCLANWLSKDMRRPS